MILNSKYLDKILYYILITYLKYIYFILLVPPSFTSIPSDQIVTETDLTTFTCAASGNPVPNITWVKDGKTVATGDTLSFEASRNRSGTYWCLADNGIGAKINTSVSLNVQCKYKEKRQFIFHYKI